MRFSDCLPYALYLFILLGFNATFFLIPYFSSNPATEETGHALFHLYRPMCHQMPSRSFFVFGEQMPVCSRCFGIYFGMLLGALAFPFLFGIRSTRLLPMWMFLGAMVPIGLDGGIQFVSHLAPLPLIGVYESTNALRLATGLLIGVVMSLYVVPLLNDVWKGLLKERHGSTK